MAFFQQMTNKDLRELGIDMGDDDKRSFTLEEINVLATMFASQKTCEERDEKWNLAVDNLNSSISNLNTNIDRQSETLQSLHDGNLTLDLRVTAIENQQDIRRKGFYAKLKASLSFIALGVSVMTLMVLIVAQSENIGKVLKNIFNG